MTAGQSCTKYWRRVYVHYWSNRSHYQWRQGRLWDVMFSSSRDVPSTSCTNDKSKRDDSSTFLARLPRRPVDVFATFSRGHLNVPSTSKKRDVRTWDVTSTWWRERNRRHVDVVSTAVCCLGRMYDTWATEWYLSQTRAMNKRLCTREDESEDHVVRGSIRMKHVS